jgi:hypothetical protein
MCRCVSVCRRCTREPSEAVRGTGKLEGRVRTRWRLRLSIELVGSSSILLSDGGDWPNQKLGRLIPVGAAQRIATVLIYLNDVLGGGETLFPKLSSARSPQDARSPAGIAVSPVPGRAVAFFPADLSGVVDHRLVRAQISSRPHVRDCEHA